MKIKIFTTSHDSKYGTDTNAYGTYKEARTVRYKMAREGWVELMENEPKPSNRDELADKYWESTGMSYPEEYFIIEEHEIDVPMGPYQETKTHQIVHEQAVWERTTFDIEVTADELAKYDSIDDLVNDNINEMISRAIADNTAVVSIQDNLNFVDSTIEVTKVGPA